jgi:hypothetical protein
MGLDVSDAVAPPPYILTPSVEAGLVTVTGTVPYVAMADPGIAAVSWLMVT